MAVLPIAYGPTPGLDGVTAGSGLTVNGSALDNDLVTGKSGGGTVTGGTGSADNLNIRASSAVTPTGKIRIGNTGAIATLTVVEGGTNASNLVGINQEFPNGQLEVKSGGNCTALFVNGGSGSTTNLRVCVAAFTGAVLSARSTSGTIAGVTSSGASLLFDGGIGHGVIGTTTAHDTVVVSNNVERARWTSAGAMQLGATMLAANNTVATVLGSLGPTGAHTTVQEWLLVKGSGGADRWCPLF